MNYEKVILALKEIDEGLPKEAATECAKAYRGFLKKNPERGANVENVDNMDDEQIFKMLMEELLSLPKISPDFVLPALLPFDHTDKGFDYWENMHNQLVQKLGE